MTQKLNKIKTVFRSSADWLPVFLKTNEFCVAVHRSTTSGLPSKEWHLGIGSGVLVIKWRHDFKVFTMVQPLAENAGNDVTGPTKKWLTYKGTIKAEKHGNMYVLSFIILLQMSAIAVKWQYERFGSTKKMLFSKHFMSFKRILYSRNMNYVSFYYDAQFAFINAI
jgi:hypothetical protein